MMMRIWPCAPLTIRKAISAFLLCAFVAVLLVMGIFLPFLRGKANYGFGPKWDCEAPLGKISALNCIKRTP
jgi:hypothetical protein